MTDAPAGGAATNKGTREADVMTLKITITTAREVCKLTNMQDQQITWVGCTNFVQMSNGS
jgi:hypothetical protein